MSVPNFVSTRSYDARGQVLSITHGNGVVTSYTYHATRGWLSSTSTANGGTVLNAVTWTRDNSGRILTVDETTPGVTGFDWADIYDEAGRLTVAENIDGSRDQSFAYSPNGNMLTGPLGTYSYPAALSARPHTPSSVAGSSITYDANGNMTAGLSRTLAYDFENRPTGITQSGVTATFSYGPEGQRFRKVRSSQTTWWLGADLEVLPNGTPSAVC